MANSAVAAIGVVLLIAAAAAYLYTVPAGNSISGFGFTITLTDGQVKPYLQYAFPLAVGGAVLVIVGVALKR